MEDDPQREGVPGKSGAAMLVVLVTFPDLEKARAVVKEIVSEGLAACASLVPKVESIYRWEGKVQQDAEALAIFKVASQGFAKLETAIIAKHPYDTPEIVGIGADRVEKSYLAWVLAAD